MATSTLFLSLLSFLLFSSLANFQSPPKQPQAIIFPIKKHTTTNQYYTTIQIGGSNTTTFNAAVDLGGKFLWFNSDGYLSSSASSYRPIHCGTRQCRRANTTGCIFCFVSPFAPECTEMACSDYAFNPFTGMTGFSGIGLESLHVHSVHGGRHTVDNFTFQFSDPVLWEGLGRTIVGVVGLGRSKISLPSILASSFKIRRRLTLCLPSSSSSRKNTDGSMIIGKVAYKNPFREMAKSLFTTPIITNPVETFGNDKIGNMEIEYFIDLKSIRVGSRELSLFNKTLLSIDNSTGGGGTRIQTSRRFTGLHGSIYRALIDEFVSAAALEKITRVPSVAPFGACFDSRTVKGSKTGPRVPTVDFVMHNKSVYWRFYGANSMFRVSGNVICLAFVEEIINELGPTSSIVVGGYQMENHLLEFDMASSTLGFSSSLLLHDTSCSQFRAS